MKTYNFVYKTSFNDGRYYIGQHKTNKLDDHYFGSSGIVRDLIKNHPELEPKREILRYCNTQDELNYWEKYFIGDNWKDDPLCINNNKGGNISEINPMQGKNYIDFMTPEAIEQMHIKKSMSMVGEKNPRYGKPGLKGEKNPCYGRTGEKHPMYGKPSPMKGKPAPNKGKKRFTREDGTHYYA